MSNECVWMVVSFYKKNVGRCWQGGIVPTCSKLCFWQLAGTIDGSGALIRGAVQFTKGRMAEGCYVRIYDRRAIRYVRGGCVLWSHLWLNIVNCVSFNLLSNQLYWLSILSAINLLCYSHLYVVDSMECWARKGAICYCFGCHDWCYYVY